ncbi:hypothetical protein BC834DRAFT_327220 [Gloeopeniophorella convolvens]|nr:hypothetical protein BC834DRAFT_327220 [Gloeopeniophorella convolvens]
MYMVLASQVASTVMSICWASYVWAAGSRFGPVSVCNATALDAVALPLATIINTPIPILCGCLLWYPYSSLHHISRRNTQPLEDLKQQQQPGEKMEVQTRFRSHLRASQLYVAFEILLVTFSVALIELMIRVYGSYFEPREGSWTFGQVIALVLLSDTALEILSASYAWRTGPS